MAVQKIGVWIIILYIVAIFGLSDLFFFSDKISRFDALLEIGVGVCLIISIISFILGLVEIAASVYFILVNFHAGEATTMNKSIVGTVFYMISFISLIVVF